MSHERGEMGPPRATLLAARRLLNAERRRPRISNRAQIALFAIATLAITAMGVAAVRYTARATELVFVVAGRDSPQAKFAQAFAKVVADNARRLHVSVVSEDSAGAALARFAQNRADIAIVRTDARPPASSRALAVVETDLALLIAPKGSKTKSLSTAKDRKIVVVGGDARDGALARGLASAFGLPGLGNLEDQPVEALPKLLEPGGRSLAFLVVPKSRLAAGEDWEQLARKPGLDLVEIDGAKALERRLRGVSSQEIEAGLVSASPRVPADDLNTIGVQELLVVHAAMGNAVAADLARIVLENKEQLAVGRAYAAAIEPPDVDKDAEVIAHSGAADYVNGDVKSFIDRYSDLLYLGMSVASIVGSVFLGLYSAVTKTSPLRAGQLTAMMFDAAERLRAAPDVEAVEAVEAEIQTLLRRVVDGVCDNTVSTEGFELFRLAFESARDAAAARRAKLAASPSPPSSSGAGLRAV